MPRIPLIALAAVLAASLTACSGGDLTSLSLGSTIAAVDGGGSPPPPPPPPGGGDGGSSSTDGGSDAGSIPAAPYVPDTERALGVNFALHSVIPVEQAMKEYWENLNANQPNVDPNNNRPAGCTCGVAARKKCCTCFYQVQAGCSNATLSQADCTDSTKNGNSFCAWYGGDANSPARCMSGWQKECIELLDGQTPACEYKNVTPKTGDLMNDPQISWPNDCRDLYVSHRGHGTGFGQCSTTTRACLTGCGNCVQNLSVSWGGCQTLSNYNYDPNNPNDPIQRLIGSLPAGCTASVQASPTTDMQGCRQNYVTINIIPTNGVCTVTITPPACGGRCASTGDTQECMNGGTKTNQICCGDPGTQGRCGYGECHFKIGNSCN